MTRPTALVLISLSLLYSTWAIGQQIRTKQGLSEAKATEVAVSTFYLAAARGDVELLKTVDPQPVWAKPEVLAKLGNSIVAFRIAARMPMKTGEGVKAGDMYVSTDEYYRGLDKPGKRHFHLRKVGGRWTILNFNIDED
jgi:hypothetical protein